MGVDIGTFTQQYLYRFFMASEGCRLECIAEVFILRVDIGTVIQ